MRRTFTILWYVLTLRCEEADRLRAISPPDKLTWWQSLAGYLHAVGCKSCWRARRQLHTLRKVSQKLTEREADQPPAPQPLSADAKSRIAEALRSQADRDD